jgi:cell division protein FtsQ
MTAALRILAWTLALLLVTLPLVALVNGWVGAEHWPLRTLRVEGHLQRVDAQRLRATVLPYAAEGFFAVQLADAQAAVSRLPWVEHAEVRKRWPDVLEVRIVEHRPFAHWGRDRLLSEHGRLFPAKGATPDRLPLLDGPDARVADVVALFNQSRAMFAPSGVDVRALTLDPRGSWSLVLSSGTDVIVGSSEARLRLARFARLMPQLLSQKQLPLVRADLRYTNGFALSWAEKADTTGNGPGAVDSAPRTDPGFAAALQRPDHDAAPHASFPLPHFRSTAVQS